MNWISVEDRLPEEKTNVLIYAPGKRTRTAFLSGKIFETFESSSEGIYFWEHVENITHWAEITPPEENSFI